MNFEDIAIKAALEAGKEILEIYKKDFEVDTKADNSPLTEADRRAHIAIKKILDDTQLPLLSEEGKHLDYESRKLWKRFWLVDPLDGTKEFVKRNGEFTVNIALIEEDYPVMGVIYSPVLEKLYFGSVGKGAWVANHVSCREEVESVREKFTPIPISRDDDSVVVVASRSHFSPETQEFVDRLKEKHANVSFTSMGSSLKICLVAEGVADVYPRFGPTMEWDTGAGHAIAKAAGKSVVDQTTGEEMKYNKSNLLNNWFVVQ